MSQAIEEIAMYTKQALETWKKAQTNKFDCDRIEKATWERYKDFQKALRAIAPEHPMVQEN